MEDTDGLVRDCRFLVATQAGTIPVILLTVLGMFYIVAVKPPSYQAGASILLAEPRRAAYCRADSRESQPGPR